MSDRRRGAWLRTNPRPLTVHAVRSRWAGLYWVAACRVCGRQIVPYTPIAKQPGMMVFWSAAEAGDEARTHLVQKHPFHPLVL